MYKGWLLLSVVSYFPLRKYFSQLDQDECTGLGNIRLVNGTSAREGRVEICYDGTYGTVCDDYWDELDATVICKQFGYALGGV